MLLPAVKQDRFDGCFFSAHTPLLSSITLFLSQAASTLEDLVKVSTKQLRFRFSMSSQPWNALLALLTQLSGNQTTTSAAHKSDPVLSPRHRFDRTSETSAESDVVIVLTIHNRQYNVTKWAKAHPGGFEALARFKGRDATRAFEAVHHSAHARTLLERFAIGSKSDPAQPATMSDQPLLPPSTTAAKKVNVGSVQETFLVHAKRKLFTKEDPVGIHKYLGLFCLLHFAYRYGQMLFFDPSAGLGSRSGLVSQAGGGGGSSPAVGWIAPLCLIPHAALSLSSLMFHTVPRHRVVGKPMIWQEYRIHNIAFGLRSVVSTFLCHLSIRLHHVPAWRRFAVVSSCVAVLVTQLVADWGTRNFSAGKHESTTATTPYWDGCSVETQKRFKLFYAYCQFMATLVCLAVLNPAWPFAILLPIQSASLFLTLVRKGLLAARGFHYGYTFTLLVPYAVGLRSILYTSRPDFLAMLAMGAVLFQLRRQGTNKYLLWVPLIAARVAFGDRIFSYNIWYFLRQELNVLGSFTR
jgi:cytochrome b involved in lipid metabolism